MRVFQFESSLMTIVTLVVFVATLWAFADALTRRTEVFPAAGKLTKPAWLLILGLSLAVDLIFGGFSILGFAGVVAMLVYLLDVRPAVSELTRRR
ncbi:MAG: DUF2516 family protein [Nocardioidaceae bacterium]